MALGGSAGSVEPGARPGDPWMDAPGEETAPRVGASSVAADERLAEPGVGPLRLQTNPDQEWILRWADGDCRPHFWNRDTKETRWTLASKAAAEAASEGESSEPRAQDKMQRACGPRLASELDGAW